VKGYKIRKRWLREINFGIFVIEKNTFSCLLLKRTQAGSVAQVVDHLPK
jgi:hypothetical protein